MTRSKQAFRHLLVAPICAAIALTTGPALSQEVTSAPGMGVQTEQQAVTAQNSDPEDFNTRNEDESNFIIVTGYRRSDVRGHVYAVFDVNGDQIDRREEPFCPRVVNFPIEYLPILEKLIRANAAKAGVPLASEDCLAEAFAIFARDPQQFTQAVRKKYPTAFSSLTLGDQKTLIEQDRPVYSWALKVLRDRFGGDVAGDPPQIFGVDISRLHRNVRHDIEGTYLVMDIDRTANITLQQLADFIFLNMVVEFRKKGMEKSAPDSILHLFDYDNPLDAPPDMSPMDFALVEAFYAQASNDRSARMQRNRITDHIMAKLEGDGLVATE
ncbi:hypothetical protein [Qipengyuania marisflavi]|uniref:Uncharacterized protein n=1 Tax=Qipengyuania marisflavi TaxID=2486356 RepID=A0A5S3P2W5_9SPHN|nr:hypothetical protein [Qipengyuania marisflavi]TMM47324.1 hypothetical protein FEV51_09665 [Qipengyuania marisflavi]